MKQAKTKLPSGEYCFQEVPEWAKDIKAYYKPLIELTMVDWLDQAENYVYPVHIPGSWQLLGADPTRLTEEEAGEIVGKTRIRHMTSSETLDSLAASLGIEKPFVVLKNKSDDNT